VVERIGAGTEAPYLLDPQMLGRFYLGTLRFEVDPYTRFSKNLSTLRLEVKSLFHVRNAKGARRVARREVRGEGRAGQLPVPLMARLRPGKATSTNS
jgi:hypothetical protein